ncbi:MAG: hypothetical protein IJ274_13580, partial [Lachnospiraceae bacterium]|nr:hypothetical protein [Lachnospiraceae bacterium]
MSKFEKKFGKYAIRNISLYMILCYVFGYIIELIEPDFLMMLALDPYKIIMEFQIWRLFTWVIIPPSGLSFWVIISLFFYWSIGTNLEHTWGTYKYNIYLLTGFLCTILGSFLYLLVGTVQFYPLVTQGGVALMEIMEYVGLLASYSFSTFYVNMSIMLLFAFTFPDVQVLLMFIIPIKVKWIGIAYAIILGYIVVVAAMDGNFPTVILIIMSLLNFLIFFIKYKRRVKVTPKQMKRRVVYKTQTRRANMSSRHKCAICGRTEADGEHLEFRYCSK